jgi:hypothetical protein
MDNFQNCDSYINSQSSQANGSCKTMYSAIYLLSHARITYLQYAIQLLNKLVLDV